MPTVARIESALGFNDAEFTRGIERAEKRAATFGGRVEATFQNLFRKSPGRRAEKALSPLIADLATGGDLSSSIISFSSRLTGLGLAAGIGVGVAIELFQKLRTDITATESAGRALANTLALSGGTRGPEEISKRFAQVRGETDALIEKADSSGTKISNFFDKFVNPALGTRSRNAGGAQASQVAAGVKEQVKLLDDLAKAEDKAAEFKQRSLDIGQRAAAVEKVRNDLAIKQTSIDEENVRLKLELFDPKKFDPDDTKAVAARDKLIAASEESAKSRKATAASDAQFQIENLNEMTARTQERYDLEEKIAKLAKERITGKLSPDDEKKLKVAAELQDIKLQQQTATFDEKRPLQIKQLEKENELRGLTQKTRNPFAYGTIAHRDFENESGFGSLAQRNKDMNDPNVWGSLGYNAMQRGELPQVKQESSEVVKALNDLVTITREVWGQK